MSQPFDIEARLRAALAPIEPPAELAVRMESRLGTLVELAADELEAWELSAMRDPRNWPRAAVGLVLVRTQRQRHRRRAQSRNVLDLAARTVRDTGREARRLLDDLR